MHAGDWVALRGLAMLTVFPVVLLLLLVAFSQGEALSLMAVMRRLCKTPAPAVFVLSSLLFAVFGFMQQDYVGACGLALFAVVTTVSLGLDNDRWGYNPHFAMGSLWALCTWLLLEVTFDHVMLLAMISFLMTLIYGVVGFQMQFWPKPDAEK